MTHHAGVLRFHSPYAFEQTVQRLHAVFAERGLKIFASIDQQAEAAAVGLSMSPTTLILFGNPKAGTPLMLANPVAGIDLPLKVLVTELEPGRVEVLINSAAYLIERHALPQALEANLLPVEGLIGNALGVKPEPG